MCHDALSIRSKGSVTTHTRHVGAWRLNVVLGRYTLSPRDPEDMDWGLHAVNAQRISSSHAASDLAEDNIASAAYAQWQHDPFE